MITEIQRYFPEMKENLSFVVRNPFLVNVSCIADENDRLQRELIELKCDLTAKQMFENSSMVQFWINMQSSYLYKEAIKAIFISPELICVNLVFVQWSI